jgi:flagellar biosynthesis chaperone FliJ
MNKALRQEYKQMKFSIGVFQIRNTLNNKIFIDSSTNLDSIWNRHKFELNMGGHRNEELQKDWTAAGEENFKYEILSEIKQDDVVNADYAKEAKQLAAMFIEELQPFGEKGYNKRTAK